MDVPLRNVCLSSELVSGSVAVGIRSCLPCHGNHLLFGAKVVVNPFVSDNPFSNQSPDLVGQEFPD